jgi:hypothetical protein
VAARRRGLKVAAVVVKCCARLRTRMERVVDANLAGLLECAWPRGKRKGRIAKGRYSTGYARERV